MKPLYFCPNCKQYHATCSKQHQLSHKSSIKFLRFSDLFNATPVPHPQNYTISSPRKPQESQLVYKQQIFQEQQQDCTGRFSHHISKNQTKRVKTDINPIKSNLIIKSKSTIKINQSKIKNRAQNKYRQNTSNSQSKLFNQARRIHTIANINSSAKNNQKQKGTNNSRTRYLNDKPTYYLTSRMKRDENQFTKQQLGITNDSSFVKAEFNRHKQVENLINTDAKTPIKTSYVYGDSNRKILSSNINIKQFKYGEIVQSREQTNQQQNIYSGKIKNSQVDARNDRLVIKQPKKQIDDVMNQLKHILKKNQGSYQKQKPFQPQKQQKKKSVTSGFHDNSIVESKNQQTNKSALQNKVQKIRKEVQLSQSLKIRQNLRIHSLDKQHNCRYFDNRCLGLNFDFCSSLEVDLVHQTDLV